MTRKAGFKNSLTHTHKHTHTHIYIWKAWRKNYNLDDLHLEEKITLKRILKYVIYDDMDWILWLKTGIISYLLCVIINIQVKETHLDCWSVLPVVILPKRWNNVPRVHTKSFTITNTGHNVTIPQAKREWPHHNSSTSMIGICVQ